MRSSRVWGIGIASALLGVASACGILLGGEDVPQPTDSGQAGSHDAAFDDTGAAVTPHDAGRDDAESDAFFVDAGSDAPILVDAESDAPILVDAESDAPILVDSGPTLVTECGSPVTLTINAQIGGDDTLSIRGDQIQWQAVTYNPPGDGTGPGRGSPTQLTVCGQTTNWFPTFTYAGGTCNIAQLDASGCQGYLPPSTSEWYAVPGMPPLPARPQNIGLAPDSGSANCRDYCTVPQQPTSANSYEAVVDLNDSENGAVIYTVTVTYQP